MKQLSMDQLHGLEERMRSAGAPVVDVWLPGLSEDEIRSEFEALPGVVLPRELVTWWQWHGGVDRFEVLSAEMGGSGNEFLSPAQSADIMLASPRDHPEWVDWILTGYPLKMIECVPESPEVARIMSRNDGQLPELLLPSLGALVDIWIDFLDREIWTYTFSGFVNRPSNNRHLLPADDHLLQYAY